MKIKGAIFDLDGTLLNSLIYWGELWQAVSRRFFGGKPFLPDEDTDLAIRTMTMKEAMTLVCRNCGVGESPEELYRLAQDLLLEFYRSKARPKEGVRELLRGWKDRGVKLCVASASDGEKVREALAVHGMEKEFAFLLSCNDVGKGKDQPDVFLEAARRLGCEPGQTVVVEDSLTALRTAQAAGFLTVGVYDEFNYGTEEARGLCDHYVDRGESFRKLIGLWEDSNA